ncbi:MULTISPECIES: ECF transporter S component [Exiguobacterium]|uniref:ECF transporter S component n=1 Tax=Exiguobacterium antarcticum TaxID=132920 RepID=A0ABT6R3L9_9BACL|nr:MULTISPECIES: ECF transporter S component [Exiguobacterium]AFS70069.1 putative metal ion ABC transporter, membrane-spanning subunit [Exiguobacterium antarcticum B7]MCT4779461.1 ECF transporter S component [Exiguobacterium soli]MDI3235362.1 ECF transporter S component [Exiguobacterium antarcticum]
MGLILSAVVAISVLILRFESRPVSEPMLRFVALVTAAAIAGRLVFSGIPNVQPATALVLLVAACVSPVVGTIVGLLVVVLTSLFLGSGPFVLFQIMAYAAICLACLLPGMQLRWMLSLYGLVAGFLYGWISNLGFLIFTDFSREAFWTLLLSGGVFDLMHGVSNLIFIWLLHPIFLRILHSFDGNQGT